jgi:hypothetical protein
MQSMSAQNPNFTFSRIALDGVDSPCGFVWQSSIQRAYTREYSDVIYLDCMKKRANTISWPYIAPVVLNGDNKIRTMAESIVCSERLDAYQFMVPAAFEMANADKRLLSSITYSIWQRELVSLQSILLPVSMLEGL